MSNLILENSTNPSTETQAVPAAEVKAAPSAPPSGLSVEADGQIALYPMPTPSTALDPSTALPDGYLDDGSLLDTDGILRSEYLGTYAQQLAALMNPLPLSTFHRAFLKEAKTHCNKNAIYKNQKNCTIKMVLQAKRLVHSRKAPAVLLPMMEAATATVHDAATFEALYTHLDAVHIYML